MPKCEQESSGQILHQQRHLPSLAAYFRAEARLYSTDSIVEQIREAWFRASKDHPLRVSSWSFVQQLAMTKAIGPSKPCWRVCPLHLTCVTRYRIVSNSWSGKWSYCYLKLCRDPFDLWDMVYGNVYCQMTWFDCCLKNGPRRSRRQCKWFFETHLTTGRCKHWVSCRGSALVDDLYFKPDLQSNGTEQKGGSPTICMKQLLSDFSEAKHCGDWTSEVRVMRYVRNAVTSGAHCVH